MSSPSVWNGRNERILGPSTDSNTSINTLPTSNVDRSVKASSDEMGAKSGVDSSSGKCASAAPAAAPAPPRSVWNGKHDKIKEIATKPMVSSSSSTAAPSTAEDVSSNVSAATPGSKAKNSIPHTKKKKGGSSNNNNGANSENNNNKVVLPSTLSKDTASVVDEGTNSTAGSSTTNTITEEETLPPDANNRGSIRSVEGSEVGRHDVVVNVIQEVEASPSNTSSLATEEEEGGSNNKGSETVEEKKNELSSSNSGNKVATEAASSSSPNRPVVTAGEKKKKKESSAPSGNATSGQGNVAKSHSRKGGRHNNNNSYNHNGSSQNNGHRGGNNKQHGNNHSSRGSSGNSGNGNGRRKANNAATTIHNADKPVCAFFIRGMCNRGTACAFKHDPAFAPSTLGVPAFTAHPSSIGYQGNPNNKLLRHGNNGSPRQNGSTSPSAAQNSMPSYNRLGSGRTFDPLKARSIQLAKDAQDKEDRSIFASPSSFIHKELAKEPTADTEPPFFSIDVECIATGYGSCAKGINDGCGNEGKTGEGVPSTQYNDLSHRYPGRVAMVDSEGNLLADIVIRPPQNGKGVVSYLTALTGLEEEMCLGSEAKSLEEAVGIIKSLLPKNGVLVGQAIDHDVEWLGLTPGKDFERMVDLSVIFRQRMPTVLSKASEALRNASESGHALGNKNADPSSDEYLGFETRYRSFSLRHVCLNLLGTDIQSGVHDPVIDARYSLTLFHKYRNSSVTQLRIVRDGLHRAPVTPGFAAEKTPVLDGVCVSAAGYPYKRAGRKIWRWYTGKKGQQSNQSS